MQGFNILIKHSRYSKLLVILGNRLINYNEIERKWQRAWDDAKVFESEILDKESLLVTAAIPYVNAPPHVGHMRTYGTADIYARYMRMKGLNVLYPFGFHATGTPVLAFAKRLQNRDQELIDELKAFHVAESDMSRMVDPVYITVYFIAQQEAELRKAGMGIDWRRKFVTTEPLFSKMIEWQFAKLKDKGYLTKGTHPVGWCTNEKNAVGQHDTKHDVQPKIEELIAIKFKDAMDDVYFPCATYRPETVYGVTNIFVNENSQYVVARIDAQRYYLSKEAASMLGEQFSISIEKEIPGKALLGRRAVNPVTTLEVPVLPGFFVKGNVGTGVVMSVPAHAPFDYVALERLKARNYVFPGLRYIKVLELKGPGAALGKSIETEQRKGEAKHSEIPALAYLEIMNADANTSEEVLELATKAVYKDESHYGVMLVGKYKGRPEPEARDGLKSDLVKSNDAFTVYALSNPEPVICRCNTPVIVKVVRDQWFIDYGNKEWKAQVHAWLDKMKIYPENYRHTFEVLVDWIDERAAERAQGLGTKFPYNPEHIIESLSDSTIYMIFYTFVPSLRAMNVKPEQLKPEFFEYIVNSAGTQADVSKSTGIDELTIKKCKDSLDYWYTNTSRHSGPDLVPNHYLMYIYNHVAILPQKFWPKQIVVNGFVNYEGKKMSKSLGNIVPLGDGVDRYGADPIRMVEIAGAGLDTETDFNLEAVNGVLLKNEFLYNSIDTLNTFKALELEHIDYWLYSKLHAKVAEATAAMDRLEFRNAYNAIYYSSIAELKWYFERGGHNELATREFLEDVSLMLSPIMPHFSEEMWHRLGNTTLSAQARWPSPNKDMINDSVDAIENMIMGISDDITNTIALTGRMSANSGKKVKDIRVILADEWKRIAYNALVDKGSMADAIASTGINGDRKDAMQKFLAQFMPKRKTLKKVPELSSDDIYVAFVGATDYLKKRFGADIIIEKEGESKSARASRAMPDKPSIDVLWG